MFTEDEYPEMDRCQDNALYITIKCKQKIISKVLIDGGSEVNILALSTIERLNIGEKSLHSPKVVVRAFDGTKRNVLGEVLLEVKIGPVNFNTTFEVLETIGSFNMSLGYPWIHTDNEVPSIVHKKVKFVIGDKLITFKGEYCWSSQAQRNARVIKVFSHKIRVGSLYV